MTTTRANSRSFRLYGETPGVGCVSLRDLAAAAGSIRPRSREAHRGEMVSRLEKLLLDPNADVREKVRSSLLRLAA